MEIPKKSIRKIKNRRTTSGKRTRRRKTTTTTGPRRGAQEGQKEKRKTRITRKEHDG